MSPEQMAESDEISGIPAELFENRKYCFESCLEKDGTWGVSEIAYALGFSEVTHFNNFFKKHVQISPLKCRNAR